MTTARNLFAICLASLVVWFGVAAAAPVHAHAIDGSKSRFLHMIADDTHDNHVAHDQTVETTDPDTSDTKLPDTGQVLHVHGCTHVATLAGVFHVSPAFRVVTSAWVETTTRLSSLHPSPPRKPPRFFL